MYFAMYSNILYFSCNSELKGSDEFEELNASRDEIAKEKKKKKVLNIQN